GYGLDGLELLGKSEHRPRQPAGPRAEWRVSLLRARAAVAAAGDVEEALVRDTAPHIESIAATSEIDIEGGRRARVLHEPFEQAHALVLFLHQPLAEHEAERQRAQRADRVDEQRMSAVERVDEAAVGQRRPAAGLHRAADFQRELVEAPLPVTCGRTSLTRQSPQVAVRADVVEPVVVHANW